KTASNRFPLVLGGFVLHGGPGAAGGSRRAGRSAASADRTPGASTTTGRGNRRRAGAGDRSLDSRQHRDFDPAASVSAGGRSGRGRRHVLAVALSRSGECGAGSRAGSELGGGSAGTGRNGPGALLATIGRCSMMTIILEQPGTLLMMGL